MAEAEIEALCDWIDGIIQDKTGWIRFLVMKPALIETEKYAKQLHRGKMTVWITIQDGVIRVESHDYQANSMASDEQEFALIDPSSLQNFERLMAGWQDLI